MTVKLLGTDTAGNTNSPAAYIGANQWACAVTGILTEIKVYCLVNSNVRAALYSDDGANGLGNLIAESVSVAITSGDWRTIAVAGGVVTAATKYWLAYQPETAGGVAYRTTVDGIRREYKSQAYGAFPADGTGFLADTNYEHSTQGWGDLPVIPFRNYYPHILAH